MFSVTGRVLPFILPCRSLNQMCQYNYVYIYMHPTHLKIIVRVHIKLLVDRSKQSTDDRSYFATLRSIRYRVHYNNRATYVLHCLMSGVCIHTCTHSGEHYSVRLTLGTVFYSSLAVMSVKAPSEQLTYSGSINCVHFNSVVK